MKILAVAHESNFNGGANRSFFTVIKILKEKYNVDVHVLVPCGQGDMLDKLTEAGFEYDVIPYAVDFSIYRHEPKDILKRVYVRYLNMRNESLARRYAVKYKNKKFDLVYSNTRMSSFGAILANELKLPHVCHVREFDESNSIWGNWTLKRVGELSNKVIAISTAIHDELLSVIPEEKIDIIFNGIDSPYTDHFAPKWNSEKINLILTGRIVEAKGHMDALRALTILRNRGYNNIVLHFAGSGVNSTRGIEYRKMLEKYTVENNLQNNVVMCGEVKDMFSLRKQMDGELMCSICEPFGRVTVEALRSGLLLIGSNTGGTLDIISDGKTGLLYQQGDAKDLADKIQWAISNPEKREIIQEQGYAFSKTHFTKEENAAQVFNTLKGCIIEQS